MVQIIAILGAFLMLFDHFALGRYYPIFRTDC